MSSLIVQVAGRGPAAHPPVTVSMLLQPTGHGARPASLCTGACPWSAAVEDERGGLGGPRPRPGRGAALPRRRAPIMPLRCVVNSTGETRRPVSLHDGCQSQAPAAATGTSVRTLASRPGRRQPESEGVPGTTDRCLWDPGGGGIFTSGAMVSAIRVRLGQGVTRMRRARAAGVTLGPGPRLGASGPTGTCLPAAAAKRD